MEESISTSNWKDSITYVEGGLTRTVGNWEDKIIWKWTLPQETLWKWTLPKKTWKKEV
jgi:hypothetical protein